MAFLCTIQINKGAYIYCLGQTFFNSNGDDGRSVRDKMLIFDMNINEYIHPLKYNHTIPGGPIIGTYIHGTF